MEFLYIDANEGTASGGHVAIRFDGEVFHFQHVPSGSLRIARDDFLRFRTLYGLAENRTIHGHRIDVSDDTWTLLRDGFNRRLLIEDEQFDQLESLGQDIRLLRLHLSRTDKPFPPATVNIKGLGLFLDEGVAGASSVKPVTSSHATLKRLQAAIERHRGTGFLESLSDHLRRGITQLQAVDKVPDPATIEANRFVPARYGYAEHYTDDLTALAALDVLQRGRDLQPLALLQPRGAGFALDPHELAQLQAYRTRLEDAIVALPSEVNANWGFPLLVGMGRLIALDISLASKHLAVLDLSSGETGVPMPGNANSRLLQKRVLERAEAAYHRARIALDRVAGIDERVYGQLERSANLFIHARESALGGQSAHALLTPLPYRPAEALAIAPRQDRTRLAGQLARLEVAERAYRVRLSSLYPYDLITNNCVSELFHTIDRILARSPSAAAEADPALKSIEDATEMESRRRLGGHVDPGVPNFIPFAAFKAVSSTWRVVETRELPSWRRQRLHEARLRENNLLVGLRESNVLTSSLYQWHEADAAFLFFSEEHPWFGVLTGSINAAVGLGQSLTGIISFPWDGGYHLRQGAKGFLISLPELVFFNIRKGSYPEFASPAAGFGLAIDE